MKTTLRGTVAATFFFLGPVLTAALAPAAALAQAANPEIRSLQVHSDNAILPGSRLRFTLRGTPGGAATIRIGNLRETIALRETARGTYTGRYVVARADPIGEGDRIRASLKRGTRTATVSYDIPAGLAQGAMAQPSLRIDRFAATSQDRLEPGAEIRFVVEGMPGASASVDLPGIPNVVRLREVRPGRYEGSYTLRRVDNFDAGGPVLANLRVRERVVTLTLAQPIFASAPGPAPLPLQVVSHANNSQVPPGVTVVRARTVPFASVNVRVQAVPAGGANAVAQQLYLQVLQADSAGHFEFSFAPPYAQPGMRYEISMIASRADVTSESRLVLFQRPG